MKWASLLFYLCFFSSVAYADMKANLEKAFQVMGGSSNFTMFGGYQDQTGGFYTGGSLFARSKANTAELYSLQLPHYRSGCGGIDLFLGGFSFINGAQFTQMLRNIGSNAAGYAFNLALATVTPQIKSVLDELSAIIQKHANASISSCEAAATLVGGAWPQSDASSQLLCNAMSKDLGLVSDYTDARQKCGAEIKRTEVLAQKGSGKAAAYKDVLGDEYNLAWKAISKNAFLNQDKSLAEFFMTLSGTIISKKGGQDQTELKVYPSLATNPDLIAALIIGDRPAEIYKCDNTDENKCLNPTLQKISFKKGEALYEKVQKSISTIAAHLAKDKALLEPEKAFVNSTIIPVLKIMAVETAFKAGGSPIHVAEFSEAIAHDILLQYLEEVMGVVSQSLSQLQKTQLNDKMMDGFQRGIGEARKVLFAKRTQVFEQMVTTLALIERTQQLESKLQSVFLSLQKGER